MKATDFEYHHQTLFHLLVVGLSLLTYLIDPDDIVWALVRHHSDGALLERIIFGAGAALIFGSAVLDTWGGIEEQRRNSLNQLYLGRLLLAGGLGLLLPLPGTIILITGEVLLVVRLVAAIEIALLGLAPVGHPMSRPLDMRLQDGGLQRR